MGATPSARTGDVEQTACEASFAVDGLAAFSVLEFCPWSQRAAVASVSPEWRVALGLPPRMSCAHAATAASAPAGEGLWRFFCERLAKEHQIYVPRGGGPNGLDAPTGVVASWHELFQELYPLCSAARSEQRETSEDQEEHTFKIAVAARFRPSDSAINNGRAVVLPLHQQVQLVREQLRCGKQEAIRMIMHERQQALGLIPADQGEVATAHEGDATSTCTFQECMIPTDSKNKENEPDSKINGCDLNTELVKDTNDSQSEAQSQAHSGILAVKEDSATVLAVTKQSGLRDFGFDRVFGETSLQEDVYDLTAKRLVMEFLNGQSASLICYGQTGSGKTFTMFSPPDTRGPLGVTVPPPRHLRGVVPRACEDILKTVGHWRERGLSADLGVSYVEVFGSEVTDLLREGQTVGQGVAGRYGEVRSTDRVGHRYVLDGHTECKADSWEEVAELLRVGDDAKRRAATAMNERSTRAHTVFVISLTTGTGRSRFYFADLGGSEQIAKSKADAGTKAPVTVVGGVEASRITWGEYYSHRQRIQETCNINKGLFSLKRVIEGLHRRSQLSREGVPRHMLPYVPYQDSKLTMILQEALGGSARTMVLATATMDPDHADESLQTLRFAEMCSQVQKRQEESQAASVRQALEQIAKEIAQVEAAIVAKERWETRLVRRKDVDTVAGAFGEGATRVREEVIPTSVLVGAEDEREHLEKLLKQQQEMEGLAGGFGRDYREMKASEATDGGLGMDFRENVRFSTKMKALDFENEGVLAEALRFFFRKAEGAGSIFGETEATLKRRLPRTEMPFGYFHLARALKAKYEDAKATGAVSSSFGKVMMDKCQEWASRLKIHADHRDELLQSLIQECEYRPIEFDATPFSEVPEELRVTAELPMPSSGSAGSAAQETPDEF